MADEVADGIEGVTEELYGVDPGDFVAARNEIVRRLRKAGDRRLAAEVAKLRRPSPAAWAVNQLVRRHRADLEELVRLGEALRGAQDRALAGAEPGELRAAGRARRSAVARLAELAERVLAERGAGAGAHAADVAATLEAASLDAGAASEVLGGRLSSSLEPPSGFGSFELPDGGPPARVERAPAEVTSEPGADRARRELEQAENAVAEARRRWEERSAKARAAVDRVAQSRRAVQDAEAEVARTEDLLAQAERRLRAVKLDAEQAEDAASREEDAAARAAERLRDADKRLSELSGA